MRCTNRRKTARTHCRAGGGRCEGLWHAAPMEMHQERAWRARGDSHYSECLRPRGEWAQTTLPEMLERLCFIPPNSRSLASLGFLHHLQRDSFFTGDSPAPDSYVYTAFSSVLGGCHGPGRTTGVWSSGRVKVWKERKTPGASLPTSWSLTPSPLTPT